MLLSSGLCHCVISNHIGIVIAENMQSLCFVALTLVKVQLAMHAPNTDIFIM